MSKVRDSASQVAEPARAAQEQEAAAKQARRQRFVATGPVRKSSRAGAVQTAARLQAQAEAGSSSDELSSPRSQNASDIEVAAEDSDASSQGRKRKRGTPEEEFDPAGNIMLNVTDLSCILYTVAMCIFMCLFTCSLYLCQQVCARHACKVSRHRLLVSSPHKQPLLLSEGFC